jgi:hypothetical protein
LPSLTFLTISLFRDFKIHSENSIVLGIYNGIISKIFSALSFYYISFDRILEKLILFIFLCLAIWLFLIHLRHKITTSMKAMFVALLSIFALYLALPTHLIVPDLGYIDTRVLIFAIFFGFLLLQVPRSTLMRGIFIVSVISLFLVHIEIMIVNYIRINQDLKEFYTIMEQIPSGKRVCFLTQGKIARYGRINPIAFFGAYYFLEKGGQNVLPGVGEGGFLRALQYKDIQKEGEFRVLRNPKPSIPIGTESSRPIYLIFYTKDKHEGIETHIKESGYLQVAKLKFFKIYKKVKFTKEDTFKRKQHHHRFGFRKYDYLLSYSDAESKIAFNGDLECIFSSQVSSRGYITLYKRGQ